MIEKISAFFPAYNEEKNIRKTILTADKVLKKVTKNYEIIVINDGSTDGTGNVVRELSEDNDHIVLIDHVVNKGYGAALITGFKRCKYEWIVFTDSDGQFDFNELPNFIETQNETNADLVIGYYRKRKVPFIRKLNTGLWQFLVRIVFGLNVRDIDCGFKLIRKSSIEKTYPLESTRGAFISTEFLVKAKSQNSKIIEIPVSHFTRKEGTATGANLDVIVCSFKDLLKLRRRINA